MVALSKRSSNHVNPSLLSRYVLPIEQNGGYICPNSPQPYPILIILEPIDYFFNKVAVYDVGVSV